MKLITLCVAALLFISGFAQATVVVDNAKARATFALAKTGAAYMDVINKGDTDDILTHVTVPADIAYSVEIHTVEMNGDMMQMRQMKEGLPLAAGEITSLSPGGYHLMLIGLKGPLNAGTTISLTFHFAIAPQVTVQVPVIKL